MQTAVNPQTGETVVLVDGAWKKADHVATNPQGQKAYFIGGQWMSDQAAAQQGSPALPAPNPMSQGERIQSSVGGRIARGMADPLIGIAQLYRRGMAGLTTVGGLLPNPVGDYFEGEARDLDRIVARSEKDYESVRQKAAQGNSLAPVDPGTDWARLGGNVVSPVNAAIAAAAPIRGGMSAVQLAGRGALMGGAGAAAQPVVNETAQGNFWTTKGIQTGAGAAAGAIATPAVSKLTQAVVPKVNAFVGKIAGTRELELAQASLETEKLIAQALREAGQSADDLPQGYLTKLRQQVFASLKAGKKLDAATVMRADDFRELGIAPTKGQITRDATQFATERNLRGAQDVGRPLMDRFTSQNEALAERLNQGVPREAFQAGDLLSSTLKSADKSMQTRVSAMYRAAEQEAGKDASVPLQGLAQDAANIVERFRDKVPAGVRERLASYGLFKGVQTRVYSPEEADDLIRLINEHVGNDRATNTALDKLRQAVKRSMTEGAVDDVFAPARAAAAKRFQLQDLIPALDDAAQGRTAPDDFVRKFIVNGKAKDVQGMAELLRQTNPEAANEARKQLAAVLQRAAFGENPAGDKIFSPERYAKVLRNIGTEKLSAFFSPGEIAQLNRVGRVGAYINATPTAAPVSTSNSGVPVMNAMIGLAPGGNSAALRLASALVSPVTNSVKNTRAVAEALRNVGPVATPNISSAQAEMIARLLSGGSVGAGAFASAPLQ